MATLKRRLHRKNGSSYDTLHLETEASLVLMDDGTTTLSSKISSMDSAINKHASRHASNGSDPVTPAAIGAYPNGTIGTIDCNTLTDGCWTISENATNSPGSIACTLYHKIWNTDFASQIAFGADHNVYYRTKTSGSWTNWYEIYSELRYPSPAKIGAAAASHKHAATDITSGTLDAARIPTLDASKIGSGTLKSSRLPTVPVSKGGTGKTTVTSGSYLVGNGTGALIEKTPAEVLANIGAYINGDTPSSTDLNSLTDGCWRILPSSTNVPSSGRAYVVYHKTWDTNFATQIAIEPTGNMYTRTKNAGTWSDWCAVYSSLQTSINTLKTALGLGSETLKFAYGTTDDSRTSTISPGFKPIAFIATVVNTLRDSPVYTYIGIYSAPYVTAIQNTKTSKLEATWSDTSVTFEHPNDVQHAVYYIILGK